MGRYQHCPQLLCVLAIVAINVVENNAEAMKQEHVLVQNFTEQVLQAIPYSNSSSVTKLIIMKNHITLNEEDRRALTSYPKLEELYLDDNLVTNITPKFFAVVPYLRVLSLAKNQISSLDPESFYGLDVLMQMNLSHNLLTNIPALLFQGLNNLQVVQLQENPWNCSCKQLNTIYSLKAAGITQDTGPRVTCASPEGQVGMDLFKAAAKCFPSATCSSNADEVTQPFKKNTHFPLPKDMVIMSQNASINQDKPKVPGNTWKFTACVAALALCTFLLIVCAIKGPSWYRLFHNYRHQRLHQAENEGEYGFSDGGQRFVPQVFTFEQERQLGEEDGYFEDPYIKGGE